MNHGSLSEHFDQWHDCPAAPVWKWRRKILAHQFTLLDAEGNYAPYERREIVFEPNEQGGSRRGSHQRCAAADEI